MSDKIIFLQSFIHNKNSINLGYIVYLISQSYKIFLPNNHVFLSVFTNVEGLLHCFLRKTVMGHLFMHLLTR